MTTTSLRVLLVTDSFPPNAGGSGWSTYELARQLRHRGHVVSIVHAAPGSTSGIGATTYDDLSVTRVSASVPNVPVLRNVLKNEQLWATLEEALHTEIGRFHPDVLHAQHVMTTVPTVRAGHRAQLPVVATVRDYWPVCYWSDLIHDASQATLCPGCSVAGMRACIPPRAGALGRGAWTLIPYMRHNLRTKASTLSQADAVLGVSSVITRDLLERAPVLRHTRVETIPNPVDMSTLTPPPVETREPFVLYAGKLATNKGVQYLLPALDAAGVTWPLVVAGDGPLRPELEADAARRGRAVQWLGWQTRDNTLDVMRRAAILAFPSYGPESLSRVLIEASALGTPIAAMDRGGTRDIVQHGETGLVSDTPDAFAADLGRLFSDAALRHRLGAAAAAFVRTRFEASTVAARVEGVYRSLLEGHA
jgi:glycosyltransferase involved in cell wall biosynthesis